MTKQTCNHCKGPQAKYQCGICQVGTCKKCTLFMEEDFIYLDKIPEFLSHSQYCPSCFDEHVASTLTLYNENVAKAENLPVFTKEKSKQTRLLNRKAGVIKVVDCEDEKHALIKMSYQALLLGYNAIIDVEFKNKKIRNGSHFRYLVDASCIPTQINNIERYDE